MKSFMKRLGYFLTLRWGKMVSLPITLSDLDEKLALVTITPKPFKSESTFRKIVKTMQKPTNHRRIIAVLGMPITYGHLPELVKRSIDECVERNKEARHIFSIANMAFWTFVPNEESLPTKDAMIEVNKIENHRYWINSVHSFSIQLISRYYGSGEAKTYCENCGEHTTTDFDGDCDECDYFKGESEEAPENKNVPKGANTFKELHDLYKRIEKDRKIKIMPPLITLEGDE